MHIRSGVAVLALAIALGFATGTMPVLGQHATLAYKWTKGETLRYRLTQKTATTMTGLPGGLPDAKLDFIAEDEAALLAGGGLSFLRPVWSSGHWQLWKVEPGDRQSIRPDAVSPDGYDLSVPGPGSYLIRMRFSPYLRIVSGQGCLEPSGREVAVIEPGGFFGEMSMLTGEPRTATVRAIDDAHVLEVPSERFREVALERPGLIEHISDVVTARRAELDGARAAAAATAVSPNAPKTLFSRIQQFLRLP